MKIYFIILGILIFYGCTYNEIPVNNYLDGVAPGNFCVESLPDALCVNHDTRATCNKGTYIFTTIKPSVCIESEDDALLTPTICESTGKFCKYNTVVTCINETLISIQYCNRNGNTCVDGECL